jgi:hypothetical protein
MGRLKDPALGNLNGKAGNIVGRDFGYDHYVSVRPKKYTVKKKLRQVGTKQRFHTAVQLAKTVVRYSELKEVWNKCNMPGKRGYNRLISANYKFLKDNHPTTENIITPKGRELIFDMLEVSNKKISCSYSIGGLIKPPFCITFIILFYNPRKTEGGLTFTLVDRKLIKPEFAERSMDKKGEKYLAEYGFNDTTRVIREKFKNAILYTAVVGTSTVKNKKWWTSTVAIDISSFKLRFIFLPRNKQVKHDSGNQTTRNIYSKKYKRQQA